MNDTPPTAAVRAIADTSRYDTTTAERDIDAACAMEAMRVMPLKDRLTIVAWLLNAR